jgi:hypothetical protein
MLRRPIVGEGCPQTTVARDFAAVRAGKRLCRPVVQFQVQVLAGPAGNATQLRQALCLDIAVHLRLGQRRGRGHLRSPGHGRALRRISRRVFHLIGRRGHVGLGDAAAESKAKAHDNADLLHRPLPGTAKMAKRLVPLFAFAVPAVAHQLSRIAVRDQSPRKSLTSARRSAGRVEWRADQALRGAKPVIRRAGRKGRRITLTIPR